MLDAYSTDDITIVRIGHMEAWQEPGKERRVAAKARVDWVNKLVRNAQGEEVASSVTVMIGYQELKKRFNGIIDMYYDDRIIIKDVEHSIIRIAPMRDFSPRWWELNLA